MASKKTAAGGFLAVAAAAAGAYFLFGRKKTEPLPPPPPTPPPGPSPKPPGPSPKPPSPSPKPPSPSPSPSPPASGIPTKVIGGGWSWPHKDEWPNVIAVMVDLNELGYSVGSFQMPGWNVGQKAARDGVRAFQRDYNDLVAYLKKWAVPQQGFAEPPLSKLDVDGWIGPDTWAAMRWAFRRADAGITPTFRKGAQTAREAGAT